MLVYPQKAMYFNDIDNIFSMKKFLISLLTIFFFSLPSYADSPLTSTDFYQSYEEYPIVRKAKKEEKMTLEFAEFLSSKDNPIDVKVALINALGWKFEGKYNTTLYSYHLSLIHGMRASEFELDKLTPDELLTLGYIKALDNYFETQDAERILLKAVSKNPESLTYNLILAITKAQNVNVEAWGLRWKLFENVINNPNFKKDIRQMAIQQMKDYMILYKDDPN